jgi:tetratricopeptide (TPR) repeat protein
MNVLLGIVVGIGAILLIILLRLSTTLFHELGHAIPALIFTKKGVEVYIGSYGDISNTRQVQIGRLKLFFKWKIFDWKIGMCRAEEGMDADWKNVIMILAGPIASLLIAIPLLINLMSLNPNSILFFISVMFIAAAGADFIINMIPFNSSIKMHDGTVAHSDGYALINIIRRKLLPDSYFELEHLYLNKDYDALLKNANAMLANGEQERFIYDFIINVNNDLKNNNAGLLAYKELEQNFKLNDQDYFNIGKLYRQNGNYSEALRYYNHFYYKNFGNIELLKELGITQIELGNNELAIKRLNTVIEEAPESYTAFLFRSRAYINLEKFELAKNDLETVKEVLPDEPLLYYHYGLLYKKLNRLKEALANFQQAEILNCDQHGLAYTIEEIKQRLD